MGARVGETERHERVVEHALDRIESLVAAGHGRPSVLLRVNPGVEAHTHEYLATGAEDSKFGFSIASGAAFGALGRIARSRRPRSPPATSPRARDAYRSQATT